MPRKYEVYIDGRPLRFVGKKDVIDRSQEMDVVNASSEQMSATIDIWKASRTARGLLVTCADPRAAWDRFSADHRFVQAAGGCVCDEAGRLLAMRRLDMWDLPKGKVDKGESIKEAALREVQEECGLQKVERGEHLIDTWHTYQRDGRDHLKCTAWYLMRSSSDERLVPQLEEGITALRWFTAEELPELLRGTYPSLHAVIDAWARRGA